MQYILSTAKPIFLLGSQSWLKPTAISGVQNWGCEGATTALVFYNQLDIFGLSLLNPIFMFLCQILHIQCGQKCQCTLGPPDLSLNWTQTTLAAQVLHANSLWLEVPVHSTTSLDSNQTTLAAQVLHANLLWPEMPVHPRTTSFSLNRSQTALAA